MAGGFLKDGINANGHKVRNVADGEVSATSKDAVNGSQLYNVVQFSTSTLTARMDSMKSRLTDDINKVGAGAAAMANLHPIEYKRNDKVSVAAAVGNYKDTTSMAVGAFYRPDAKLMVSVSGSVGSNDNMIGIGYSQRFGKVSEFDGMTDEELQGKVHELSEALKAKDDAFEKRLAQNETKAKAMEQENIALKAQMKALTARLDALTATKWIHISCQRAVSRKGGCPLCPRQVDNIWLFPQIKKPPTFFENHL